MHATFLKRKDFYTPCARRYVFPLIYQTISVSLSCAQPFCSSKPAMYPTASIRCHQQADVNIDHCADDSRACVASHVQMS